MYRLKKGVESFEVVDGKYAGRKYKRGKPYADIPPEEKKKFETIRETSSKKDGESDGGSKSKKEGGNKP